MIINFDDFKKIEMKIGEVVSAQRVEGSDKLLKLMIDIGELDEGGLKKPRQILAGIGKNNEPESLVGKQIAIVANLEPRMMMGLESQGMVLAVTGENGPLVLNPAGIVPPGTLLS